MDIVPIQVKSKRDGRNTQLPSLKNDIEVNPLFESLVNLIHHISLGAKQMIHLAQPLFFGFNLELITEFVKVG